MRKRVITFAAMAAIGTAAAAARAQRPSSAPSCVPHDARIVARSRQVVAYTKRTRAGVDLWACNGKPGHRYRRQITNGAAFPDGDGSYGAPNHMGPGPVVVNGERLAVSIPTFEGHDDDYTLQLLNVLPGRAGKRFIPFALNGPVSAIALDSRGSIVWIYCILGSADKGSPDYFKEGWVPCRRPYRMLAAVQVHYWRDPPTVVHNYAIGCGINPLFLRLRGDQVSWMDRGHVASGSLLKPPPPGTRNFIACDGSHHPPPAVADG